MGDVRIGEVQNVNVEKRQVRVYFKDVDMMSGWLTVIRNDEFSIWLPKIGDYVLCLYMPGFNPDGFVLGAI